MYTKRQDKGSQGQIQGEEKWKAKKKGRRGKRKARTNYEDISKTRTDYEDISKARTNYEDIRKAPKARTHWLHVMVFSPVISLWITHPLYNST